MLQLNFDYTPFRPGKDCDFCFPVDACYLSLQGMKATNMTQPTPNPLSAIPLLNWVSAMCMCFKQSNMCTLRWG